MNNSSFAAMAMAVFFCQASMLTWICPAVADAPPPMYPIQQSMVRKDQGATQVDLIDEDVRIYLTRQNVRAAAKYVLKNFGPATTTKVALPLTFRAIKPDENFHVTIDGKPAKVDAIAKNAKPRTRSEDEPATPYYNKRVDGWSLQFKPGQTIVVEAGTTRKYEQLTDSNYREGNGEGDGDSANTKNVASRTQVTSKKGSAANKIARHKIAQQKIAQQKIGQQKTAQQKIAQQKIAQQKIGQQKTAQAPKDSYDEFVRIAPPDIDNIVKGVVMYSFNDGPDPSRGQWKGNAHHRKITVVFEDGLTRDNLTYISPPLKVVSDRELTWETTTKPEVEGLQLTLWRDRSYSEQIARLQQLRQKYPRNAYIVQRIGELHQNRGRYDAQLKLYADFLLGANVRKTDESIIDSFRSAFVDFTEETHNDALATKVAPVFARMLKPPADTYGSEKVAAWTAKYEQPSPAPASKPRRVSASSP